MLFSILTPLAGVSASAILSAFEKYIQGTKKLTKNENAIQTFEIPPLAVYSESLCENETKNESKSEDDNETDNIKLFQEEPSIEKVSIDVTSKTEMLPILKLTNCNYDEDERLNNLDDKLDELLKR
ncbi:hypothetical protein Glove_87g270 [Diversispora epigaea]|uniref:Uncharacterized protein n=1 Tax=Diversispora epigaea TaxID=1348612 RepID=A0A397J8Q7_9GLOM|nr:hypothetical protein Glove_87g270 [Diversispora epigaea]